jgi:hypothetical protein
MHLVIETGKPITKFCQSTVLLSFEWIMAVTCAVVSWKVLSSRPDSAG